MSKYGPATEKQIDYLIAFMEVSLIRRKFTPAESANMRQVLYTIVRTAQLESNFKILTQLKNNLDENNALPASKLGESLKKLKAFCQPPSF